jgi:HK97 family phage major capsid protein
MRITRTMAGFALALIAAILALPLFGMLTPEQAATGLLLANAPVAVPEIKSILDKIMQGLEDFKKTNDERLSKLEKGGATSDFEAKLGKIQADLVIALAMKKDLEALEAKSNLAGLLGGGGGNTDKAAYKAAFFGQFVRKGQDTAELKTLEQKAWSIGTPADGGYAVPEELDRAIEKLQRDMSPIRSIANVVRVGTSDYKKLVNVNGIASGWVGETAARPATNTSQLAEVTPFMGELYANPQVTQQALDDMFFNVEAELMDQLMEEFAVAEGSAFVSGNGTNKPKGFLAYTTAATADSARAFGTLEHIATGVAGDWAASNKGDVLYDVISKLKAGYRAGSVWVMPKTILFEIMKFKDTQGNYLWQPRLTDNGLGLQLTGYPVTEAEDMPAKAANSLSVAFGNFRRGYTVVDRVGMRMLRDPYSNKPYVGFYTTKRVGGMVVNSEAIKLVKFAAA